MIRHLALAMSISFICAAMAPVVQAAPEFVNDLALDGAKLDLSGGTTANTGRVGYFSDIFYDRQAGTWWGLSDRGPGGGFIDYETRVQRFSLNVNQDTGAITGFEILQTIIFRDGDEHNTPFNGKNPSPTDVLGVRSTRKVSSSIRRTNIFMFRTSMAHLCTSLMTMGFVFERSPLRPT